ncbi:MAG: hypothetical protein LBH82_04630 [Bacteroidales bacterium]|jgi:hypothetical protein|nr:hypothetical protein [Bacteroidales bacterium]
MRKIIVTITMFFGICTFAYAQTPPPSQGETQTTEAKASDDGYKEVKIEALNQAVQMAIKANYADFTVKTIAYNAEKKMTKVTFTTKEEKEVVVVLNEEGKEIKE